MFIQCSFLFFFLFFMLLNKTNLCEMKMCENTPRVFIYFWQWKCAVGSLYKTERQNSHIFLYIYLRLNSLNKPGVLVYRSKTVLNIALKKNKAIQIVILLIPPSKCIYFDQNYVYIIILLYILVLKNIST